ncbi:hypothetical protein BHU76_04990 [Enterococcus faecalis]|nr:hypothetical protein BHU76_04990 [Enterococcus faecalis]
MRSNLNAEAVPTNVVPSKLNLEEVFVLIQSVGASETTVRNESELLLSVVKVNTIDIAESIVYWNCLAFRTGAKTGTIRSLNW